MILTDKVSGLAEIQSSDISEKFSINKNKLNTAFDNEW